jgi:molybdopterin-containing oxidoreductase family membrane subunit
LKPSPCDSNSDAILFEPILGSPRRFYKVSAILLAVIAFGAFCVVWQFYHGLGVTGLNDTVSWGFYITNFVFFIGISHAGTLISAILRLCQAEWRRPITRMAEVITVMVLAIGGANILIDLGRADRALNVMIYGRHQSPLLWDATSITAYFTASTFYLWLPMIPDIAILRDRVKHGRWFYSVLAMGWQGTKKQVKALERGITIMSILVIPIAVSVHTVVSFVFSMTLQPMWHSTIFGPYFVVGAIFSGIAALIIAMLIIRKAYRLEAYLKEIHFRNLGSLLLTMVLLWTYFTFSEYLTALYGNEPEEMRVFWSKISGSYAPYFWAMVACNLVIPMALLCNRKKNLIPKTLIASITICIGMWLERVIIIVPTLANPRMHYETGHYWPTWIEWGEMAGCFALFTLFFMLFTRLFPIISIWEIREGRTTGLHELNERIRGYLPDTPEVLTAQAESARG